MDNTTFSHTLRTSADQLAYDAACKKVLSEKSILAYIMRDCLDEYKDCDVKDISDKY